MFSGCERVKGTIAVAGNNNIDRIIRLLVFKNNAPFINCISKVNNILIDNAEDLDIVMPMCNSVECGKNYRKTTGIL